MLTNSTDRLTNIQLYRRYLTGDSFALKRLKIRHAALYIFQNDSDELSNCDICQHPLSHYNENEIIFCDLCNLGVHQFCYKRDISLHIPEGDWFCLRCKTLLEDGLDSQMIRCMLCWDVEGSIIPLKKDGQWVHNTCVNWIKELYFEESSKARGGSSQSGMQNMATQECTMSGSQPEEEDFISGMSGIVVGKVGEEKLYGEECEYCRHQFGVCIKCDKEGCEAKFHVRCAIRNQLIRRFDRMHKPPREGSPIPIYCKEHDQDIIIDLTHIRDSKPQKPIKSLKLSSPYDIFPTLLDL
ncbi:hypothetical protein FGO68_gene17553 [Halteria grandinella]|uniref:PHD-type domain-containing protein n=1 Tax=Halteria grandinella TaxID=5974 RepID=A0A8J8NLI6_HALGN|nr:hypothetical protein FGO68_gene17553 [Halteria grandinella]